MYGEVSLNCSWLHMFSSNLSLSLSARMCVVMVVLLGCGGLSCLICSRGCSTSKGVNILMSVPIIRVIVIQLKDVTIKNQPLDDQGLIFIAMSFYLYDSRITIY